MVRRFFIDPPRARTESFVSHYNLNSRVCNEITAPTNAAFDALPEGTVDDLLADIPALTNVLTYHVVPGSFLSADLVTGPVDTVEGSPVYIDVSDGVKVNDADVTKADVLTSNGVIHVIDKVLIPGNYTPEEMATYPPTVSPGEDTGSPSFSPSSAPTQSPTKSPTMSPTISPTKSPSESPTRSPSVSPTESTPVVATYPPTTSPGDDTPVVATYPPTVTPGEETPVVATFSPTVSPEENIPVVTTPPPTESPGDDGTDAPTGGAPAVDEADPYLGFNMSMSTSAKASKSPASKSSKSKSSKAMSYTTASAHAGDTKAEKGPHKAKENMSIQTGKGPHKAKVHKESTSTQNDVSSEEEGPSSPIFAKSAKVFSKGAKSELKDAKSAKKGHGNTNASAKVNDGSEMTASSANASKDDGEMEPSMDESDSGMLSTKSAKKGSDSDVPSMESPKDTKAGKKGANDPMMNSILSLLDSKAQKGNLSMPHDDVSSKPPTAKVHKSPDAKSGKATHVKGGSKDDGQNGGTVSSAKAPKTKAHKVHKNKESTDAKAKKVTASSKGIGTKSSKTLEGKHAGHGGFSMR